MRVVCGTVDEFIENLQNGDGEILQNTVRVSRTRNPWDDNKMEEVRFDVVFQVSAVVDMGEDGQYLLEAGERCGTDYEDSTKEMAGSDRATVLRRKIEDYCGEAGLTVLPGVIDM